MHQFTLLVCFACFGGRKKSKITVLPALESVSEQKESIDVHRTYCLIEDPPSFIERVLSLEPVALNCAATEYSTMEISDTHNSVIYK